MTGDETQQTSLNQGTGYSDKARCTGKLSYLEPYSQSMKNPVKGLLSLYAGALYKGAIVFSEHLTTLEMPNSFTIDINANLDKHLMRLQL
jgi:hypothetical protein